MFSRRMAPKIDRERRERETAEAAAKVTRYRCREHPERGVNWRGRGCPICTNDRDERNRERARVKAARRERRPRGAA